MVSKELLKELQQYVDKYLGDAELSFNEDICYSDAILPYPMLVETEMADFINNNKKPSFAKILFEYMDKLETSDSEVYKKAGLDRRHFSKIRSKADYHPSKNTAIALAFALNLNQNEVDTLLGAAGYTLSDSETFDLVITFCLNRKIYDLNDVNLALNHFSLKPLSGALK